MDSMSLKQYLDLKVPKTYKEQDLRKPLAPVWHCGNVFAGTLGGTHLILVLRHSTDAWRHANMRREAKEVFAVLM